MIKIALKHFIYEKCISVLFDTINRNFRLPKATQFCVHQQYDYIKAYQDGVVCTFYICSIFQVNTNYIIIKHRSCVEYGILFKNRKYTNYPHANDCFASLIYYNQIMEVSPVAYRK